MNQTKRRIAAAPEWLASVYWGRRDSSTRYTKGWRFMRGAKKPIVI